MDDSSVAGQVVVAQFSEGCRHMSGLSVRSSTAGHDDIRDTDRLINFARCIAQ